MRQDNFENQLTEALKDYVKTKESESADVPKVEFSKRHEENMKKLFKSVADGTFGDFEDTEDYNLEETSKVGLKNTRSIYIKPLKVAVFVLLGLIVSLAIAPTMSAWRKEELGFYGEDMDEYAWGLRNNKTEILEAPRNNVDEYMEMFGYLPEGFRMVKNMEGQIWRYVEFKDENNNNLNIKKRENSNGAIDMDDVEFEKRYINNIEITYVEKTDKKIAVWCIGENEYQLYGNIEWDEIKKIISNIKYENF